VLVTRIIFLCKSWTVKTTPVASTKRFILDMILALLDGEETRWGILNWPPIPGLNLPSASQREAANAAFITRLRAFVDGFIQTGIDSGGSRHRRAAEFALRWMSLRS